MKYTNEGLHGSAANKETERAGPLDYRGLGEALRSACHAVLAPSRESLSIVGNDCRALVGEACAPLQAETAARSAAVLVELWRNRPLKETREPSVARSKRDDAAENPSMSLEVAKSGIEESCVSAEKECMLWPHVPKACDQQRANSLSSQTV
eukprot:3231819-Pleurochrysis_carterae.AAC.4